MNITFKNPGLEYSIGSIEQFQTEEQGEWWRESLFLFYPQLDRARFDALDSAGRHVYLKETLAGIYEAAKKEIAVKESAYQEHWNQHRKQVEDAFCDAFDTDVRSCLNDIVANITLNPICPRYLQARSFDVFYLNSEKGALGMSLHELIHFAWFMVWNQRFHDDDAEYETPSLKWVFSEMAVDAVMRDKRLSTINPYSPNECVYDYFYSMTVEGKPILETLFELYATRPIGDFMQQGLLFCQTHENEIRKQMK